MNEDPPRKEMTNLIIFCSKIIKNGRITISESINGQALGIKEDNIVFVGSNEDAEKYIQLDTIVTDVSGKFVSIKLEKNGNRTISIDNEVFASKLGLSIELKSIYKEHIQAEEDVIDLGHSSPISLGIESNNVKKDKKYNCMGAYCSLPDFKWRPGFFFMSIAGSEYFHLYLWALKDLAWLQDWLILGYIFGILALAWSVYILVWAVIYKNLIEVWHTVGQFFWLLSNFIWMTGELHDWVYPNGPVYYPDATIQGRKMMIFTITWLAVYYVCVFPWKWLPESWAQNSEYYDRNGAGNLPKWISWLFPTIRSMENIHIVFWLLKDFSWNLLDPVPWIIFIIPTLSLAVFFVIFTSFQRGKAVLHVHMIFQMNWVMANTMWAIGEIWLSPFDSPQALFIFDVISYSTYRWWASWILVGSFFMMAIFYIVWFSTWNCIEEKYKYGEIEHKDANKA